MKTLNRVTLLGVLTKDPVCIVVNEKEKATFPIPTHEYDSSGKEYTDWHSIVAWGNLAQIIKQHLKKGSQVYVEGKLKTRSYEKDGKTHYVTEVLAQEIVFCGEKGVNARASSNDSATTDDLPF